MMDSPLNSAPKDERRARHKRGLRAEFIACLWLRSRGFRIISQRHRTPVGEIDIIARKGNTVAFIEVKRRQTLDDAASAIPHYQRQRIARSALHWLGHNRRYENHEMSLDVILMAPFRWPIHIKGAFEPD